MQIVDHVRRLPRELQYIVFRYVGWHHGCPRELVLAARQRQAPWVVGKGWSPSGENVHYSIPKWCLQCGESKERLVRCPMCTKIDYMLIYFGQSTTLSWPDEHTSVPTLI